MKTIVIDNGTKEPLNITVNSTTVRENEFVVSIARQENLPLKTGDDITVFLAGTGTYTGAYIRGLVHEIQLEFITCTY